MSYSERGHGSTTHIEPNRHAHHVNSMIDDQCSVATTSHCFQQQKTDGADSFSCDEYSTQCHGQSSDVHIHTGIHSDSEGNLSNKTSKKGNKALKINSSCDISGDFVTNMCDNAPKFIVQKKTSLKKSTVPMPREKPFKAEHKVMFLQQDNYERYTIDQCSSYGSSNAADSMKYRFNDTSRLEKATNCRPVPNVDCHEIVNSTEKRTARLQGLVRKIVTMRQKERQLQQWNSFIDSLKNKHKQETCEDAAMKTFPVKNKYANKGSATEVIEKAKIRRLSIRRSQTTSIMGAPPFAAEAPSGNICQNLENLAMPYNFAFYQNQACFYPATHLVAPQHPHNFQCAQWPYYQTYSQERTPAKAVEIQQKCHSMTSNINLTHPDTNTFNMMHHAPNKRYFLVHTSMQTDTADFGAQFCEKREIQTNTDSTVDIPEVLNDGSNPVLVRLEKKTENIERLKKNKRRSKTTEASLMTIEDKLDALLQSIHTFIAKVHDVGPPTNSSTSTPLSTTVTNNNKSRSQNLPSRSMFINNVRPTSSRAQSPYNMPTSNKSMQISSKTPPPQKKCMGDNLDQISSKTLISASRSEPHRVQGIKQVVSNVLASAGSSFIAEDRSRCVRSSRSKLDIIKALLEEIENNRVTRDTDSLSKIEEKTFISARNSNAPSKKDSVYKTPLIEKEFTETNLERYSRVLLKQHSGCSNMNQRIVSIAVNTEPMGIFSLFRISKDALKQFLSYVPQMDALLPRYLNYSSYFAQTSIGQASHYLCNICGAAFVRPSQLSDHIATHSRVPARSCCVCRHVLDRTKAGMRPGLFACRHCGQHFTRAYCCQLHQQACGQVRGIQEDVESDLAILK